MIARPVRAAIAALSGIALLALTGCVGMPFACPAIGWTNVLTVELVGDTSSIANVQLCTDDGCAPGKDIAADNPLQLVALTDRSGDTWTFATDMLTLEEVTVRTLASDGAILSEDTVRPDWERVGGSEQCGGPAQALVSIPVR